MPTNEIKWNTVRKVALITNIIVVPIVIVMAIFSLHKINIANKILKEQAAILKVFAKKSIVHS